MVAEATVGLSRQFVTLVVAGSIPVGHPNVLAEFGRCVDETFDMVDCVPAVVLTGLP